jgi:hypothetical protein
MHYFDQLISNDANFPPVYNAKGMIYDKLENYSNSYN